MLAIIEQLSAFVRCDLVLALQFDSLPDMQATVPRD